KGLYEEKRGKLNKAIKWFIQAKQAYPRENEWYALINLSKIHRELGQYDLALQNCKDALAINPNNRFVKDEIKVIEKERSNKK
ncbi:MAG: tetratricopeptide repeat protein, partial [Elusimicrobia bacterium]|nr:tetratricopeptide repeat protein [Elusimicrobiota bacterium]